MIYTKDWLHMDFYLSTKCTVYKLATYIQPLPVSMIYGYLGALSSLILVYLVILIPWLSVNVVTSRQTKTF